MGFERGTQLKGYIQRELKEKPMHSNYGYNYYFCRQFLERLYGQEPEKFVLKGSIAQFTTLKKFTRPITDIDLVTFGDVETASDIVDDLLKKNDSIHFDVKQRFVTNNATINYRVLCRFDNIEHLITFDLRKEHRTDSTITNLPTHFSRDKEFPVHSATLEEHFSRKLYITLLHYQLYKKLGRQYTRFKDLADIHSILSHGDINTLKVVELLQEKIKNDGFLSNYIINGKLIEKQFIVDNQKDWEVYSKKYEFDRDLTIELAVESTNDFLDRSR